MQTIKIFIASSSELKEDRDKFRLFISTENDRLHSKGIYFQIVQWEYFLDAISDTRLQDEYNNAIAQCDIVLCLFFTKVGKYTDEEFDTAYKVFKATGKPKIWTYFKNADINTGSITNEITTLLAFKKKLGELGHFYTQYTSIDNLINQYRSQLDRFLEQYEQTSEASQSTGSTGGGKVPDSKKEPIKNTFNEQLTKRLIEAIGPYNKKANDFLTNNPDWQENAALVQTAKRLIISGYVGAIGIQLRKIISIGAENYSESKVKRYLENCHLAGKKALQLLCYTLLSVLWDNQQVGKIKFSQKQKEVLVKFFKNATDETIIGYTNLLRAMIEACLDNKIELIIPEIKDLLPKLGKGESLHVACSKLNEILDLIEKGNSQVNDCTEAENQLSVLLENVNFLAAYKMISIKDIGYNLQRNDPEGLYLHNYTLLDGDGLPNDIAASKIRKDTSPVISYAVLLFKDSYRENINLDPFIIDYNGLALTGGSKICFYSYCNTYDNLGLNYSFIEDNSPVSIVQSNNPKPDDANLGAVNKWLSNPENRKDLNFDKVYNLFHEAKKALAGIEEEVEEESEDYNI